jgi:hypothetical protein
MSIRIGSSCAKSLSMVTSTDRVVETRRFLVYPTQWYEIARKCIAENKFLIVTVCIGRDDKLEYMPTNTQWREIIDDTVTKLLSLGANKYNTRIDIINEPMKYCSKEKYVELVNIAYDQINKRFKMGAGCEELNYEDFYTYLSAHGNFDVLVIHIQGACQNEADTSRRTNFAKNLAVTYKREIDCNEANMFDVSTSSGYDKLKMQLKYAEKIGCSNFCVVFHNLDQSAFSQDTAKWKFLSFKVNNMLRSNYWENWKSIINDKAPIPNIYIPIIEELDDMKLEILQYGSKGNQVKWLQKILLRDYQVPNPGGIDGSFGKLTEQQVKDYQEEKEIKIDGKVGLETTEKLIEESSNPQKWFRILQILMAYE